MHNHTLYNQVNHHVVKTTNIPVYVSLLNGCKKLLTHAPLGDCVHCIIVLHLRCVCRKISNSGNDINIASVQTQERYHACGMY